MTIMTHRHKNPLQLALEHFESNPLLADMPTQMSLIDLAKAMSYQPIAPTYVRAIDLKDRTRLVSEYRKVFVPSTQTLAIARSLQQMLHEGLSQRDPHQTSAKKFIYQGGQLKDQDLSKLEWWPSFASGMVIEGITGTGKSQLMDRFLSFYPQVLNRGSNPECGWTSLKQLVWLKIHMPSDGSRGGFLKGAFLALDDALDTDYTEQYASHRWTVEKNLVVFLHLLSVHRCGLLIIEEAQEKNLSKSAISREFITFFLRLLNWGIPTVLMGNPLAFSQLRAFSQDVDRFSEGGWFHIHPMMDHQSEEWIEDWLPNLWLPTLLDFPDAEYTAVNNDPIDQTLAGFVWKRTGGVPRYVCRLRREVQDAALRAGATQVTPAMVDEVYRTSEKMIPLHKRIEAFVRKDWRALQRFDDVPWDYFRRLWNSKSPCDDELEDSKMPATALTKTSPKPRAKRRTNENPQKPRPTKANPTPSQTPSDSKLKAKEFQDDMMRQIAEAAGFRGQ